MESPRVQESCLAPGMPSLGGSDRPVFASVPAVPSRVEIKVGLTQERRHRQKLQCPRLGSAWTPGRWSYTTLRSGGDQPLLVAGDGAVVEGRHRLALATIGSTQGTKGKLYLTRLGSGLERSKKSEAAVASGKEVFPVELGGEVGAVRVRAWTVCSR